MSYVPILFLTLLLLLIAAAWAVSRGTRQRRLERRSLLRKRAAQFRVVLDDIPPRYLGEEVTRFLLTEIATCYADSLVADPGNTDDERDLHDVRREIARLSEPKTVPDWLPTTDEEAVEVRKALNAAIRLISQIHSTGGLSMSRAKSLMQHLTTSIAKSRLDTWTAQAHQAHAAREPRREALLWRRALEEFQHLPQDDENLKRMEQLRAYLDRAHEEIRLRAAESLANATPAPIPAQASAVGGQLTPHGAALDDDLRQPFPRRR